MPGKERWADSWLERSDILVDRYANEAGGTETLTVTLPTEPGTYATIPPPDRAGTYVNHAGQIVDFSEIRPATLRILAYAKCQESTEGVWSPVEESREDQGRKILAWCNSGEVKRDAMEYFIYESLGYFTRTVYSGGSNCPPPTPWVRIMSMGTKRGKFLRRGLYDYQNYDCDTPPPPSPPDEKDVIDGMSHPNVGESFMTGEIVVDAGRTVFIQGLPPSPATGEPAPQFEVMVGHRIVTRNTPRGRDLSGQLRLVSALGNFSNDAYTIEVAARDESGSFRYDESGDQVWAPYTVGQSVPVVERGHSGSGTHDWHSGFELFRFTINRFEPFALTAEVDPNNEVPEGDGEPRKSVTVVCPQIIVDSDRDGTLSFQDVGANSGVRPFRFWSNDEDDQGPAAGDNMPGQPANLADYNNTTVDSVRDLVDFFPVFLDIKQLLGVLPHTTAGITYKLKHADGALNFVYTNKTRAQAFDYQTQILTTGFGPSFTQAAADATTEQITAAGATLNTAFLDHIKNNDGGVIFVEGRTVANPTHGPLRLVVEKQGVGEIAEVALNIKISPVEQMFRHVNLTAQVQEYDAYGSGNYITPPKAGVPTDTAQPADYPDSLTNGKYFVFIHGFNVDADSARGWNAEVFKRMHAMGSKARFVGVQWNGSPPSIIPGKYLDYHKAVFQAFQTGDRLASALSFANGADVTVAAHSLGNVVTSHAIQSGGFTPTRYYMINAASPIEAYSLADAAGQFDVMRHEHWVPYAGDGDARLYASKWHDLFASTPTDKRNALTWKKRFENIALTTGLAHNFFSDEEDVVGDGDQIDDASILEIVLQGNLPAVMTGEYSWKLQELVKGASFLSSAASAVLERRQGGWGFSTEWNVLVDNDPGPGTTWISKRRPSDETGSIPTEGLKTEPFFRRFLEADLMSADATAASNKAGEKQVQYDVLARAIPAMSNAVAANHLASLGTNNNYAMHANKPNGWHDAANRWKHSDFCYVALPYVYPMFQEMISRGGLNQ